MIKILTALHTLPEIKTYRTIFFEKIIPVLKEKFDVQVYWLVYTPEKLSNSIKEKNDRILDIHDFQNAVEVIEKVKPDIIISAPTLNLPDFALTLAAKFYNICHKNNILKSMIPRAIICFIVIRYSIKTNSRITLNNTPNIMWNRILVYCEI